MQRRRRQKIRTRDLDAVIRNLAELQPGSPVVHEDHGVGRYLGLQKLNVGNIEAEFLTLEYAGGDKLYVPVSSLHLISRYSGASPEHTPLHKLGSGQWEKAKRKASEKARDVAAELLDIYAKRAARQGFAYPCDPAQYNAFAAGFPFEETPDQHLWRRRLRQNRSGDARRLCRSDGRQAGGDAGPHHPARRTALPELSRPLRRLAGAHRKPVALPL
jgi:transcription-repair coupling factor (superfamily II helicase)